MSEVLAALAGALITLAGAYLFTQRDTKRAARYLAIRVVCVLDKYLTDCIAVVKDDGLCCGQKTSDGYLETQAASPGPPVFPSDIDWKSIDHDLMYQILSLPSEVEYADNSIKYARDISSPPDFEEYFEERAFWYAQFGVRAHDLVEKLSQKYNIPRMIYPNWDPISDFKKEFEKVKNARDGRMKKNAEFIKSMTK